MAERRMMAKSVIDSDVFLDMPLSAQALYFHFLLRADDDGFIKNPSAIRRAVGCSADDLKLLIAKQFIIEFASGVIVVTHWKLHNYIQKDRYRPTDCPEMMQVELGKDKIYHLITIDTEPVSNPYPDRIQVVSNLYPPCIQNGSIGKDRLGKVNTSSSSSGDHPEQMFEEDEKFGKVATFFSNNLHPISSEIERDWVIDAVQTYSDEWVIAAIEEAVKSGGGRAGTKYLDAILQRWAKDGFKAERKGNGQRFSKDPRRSERKTARETARTLRVHGSDWSTGDSGGW